MGRVLLYISILRNFGWNTSQPIRRHHCWVQRRNTLCVGDRFGHCCHLHSLSHKFWAPTSQPFEQLWFSNITMSPTLLQPTYSTINILLARDKIREKLTALLILVPNFLLVTFLECWYPTLIFPSPVFARRNSRAKEIWNVAPLD